LFDRITDARRAALQDGSCRPEKKRYIFLLRDDLGDRIVQYQIAPSGGKRGGL
jgi:hypothetical protein